MKKVNYIIICALLLTACGGEETQDESTNNESTVEETVVEETEEIVEETIVEETEEEENLEEAIIGDWEYVETTTYIGSESMTMKAANKWTMSYKDDGTFYEMQQIVEGGEEYVAEGTFSLNENVLTREGLLLVEIKSISENEMIILSAGSEMKFIR